MSEQSVNVMLEATLKKAKPFRDLIALANAFKSEGMSQRDMYELFDQYRGKHQNDTDVTIYEAILDTMDLIVGNCSPNARIFDSYLRTK